MVVSKSISFGRWIKKRRKTLDLTQGELAKRVGCALITVQKIEYNKRRPSKQMAGLLAEHLGVPDERHQEFIRFARGVQSTPQFDMFHEIDRSSLWGLSTSRLTNIPIPPTPLIGRDQDVNGAQKRLLDEDARLLTLVGPPGVGKTRMAIQVTLNLLDEFRDGAYFISLAQVNDSNLVAATIAQTLGVNQIGELSFEDRLKEYLSDKHMLLVLDNFEQIVAAGTFVAELLTACPWLKILITSRAPLSIRCEYQFPVSPLTLPVDEKLMIDLSELMRYSAIELFIRRTQAVRPDFVLTTENAPTIVAICTRLDGLPLAIELLAVRVSFMSPQILLEQLEQRTLLHTDSLRDVSQRHQTLYNAIDWSYALLAQNEQRLLAQLSVFSAGWTIEAAERLMSDQHAPKILESLNSLVKNNLIVRYTHHGETRFTLLETIRTYALERLVETGKEADVRKRHAEYYLALAEEADSHLRTSAQLVWLNRLEMERGNFRIALLWFIDHFKDAESGLRLTGALAWFWTIRCHLNEGREWSTKALQMGTDSSPILQARVLFGLGNVTWLQGDIAIARSFMEESAALYRDLGPKKHWDLTWVLTGLALIAAYQADYDATLAAAEEAVALARQVDDEWMVALALCARGEACMMRQDYIAARSCFKKSSRIFRKIGDKFGLGAALLDWGYLNSIQKNYEKAFDRLVESKKMFHQIGERWMRAITLNILGQVVQQQGDYNQAALFYSESLDLLKKMGLETSIADVLFNLAQLTQSQGHLILAKRLHEECLALFLKQGNKDKALKCRDSLAILDSH